MRTMFSFTMNTALLAGTDVSQLTVKPEGYLSGQMVVPSISVMVFDVEIFPAALNENTTFGAVDKAMTRLSDTERKSAQMTKDEVLIPMVVHNDSKGV